MAVIERYSVQIWLLREPSDPAHGVPVHATSFGVTYIYRPGTSARREPSSQAPAR